MGVTCSNCGTDNTQDSEFCKKCAAPLTHSEEKHPPTQTLEVPKEELTTGSTFAGRYQIIEELGKGGMGKVYKVLDKETKEKIALKLIKPEIASDKKTIERFRNELTTARKISQKNVCRMYDLNREEGSYYITMEYVSGGDLKKLIRRTKQLTAGTAISIAKQICEGLDEAHALGIVHRDLKPSNIMIDENGNACIMDFGIARPVKSKGITGSGVVIGTPEYMSPEQAEAKEIDQRSDIYSLGVILYEMVTGRVPFKGDTPLAVAMKHKGEVVKDPKELNPQTPDDLSRVILRCLEKEKEKRYQSAGEVRSELENIEKGIPTTEREASERKPLTSREITVQLSPRKLLIPALVIIAIAVIGLILWNPWAKKEAAPITSDKPSLAVMYFKNNTGDESLDHYRTSLPESIIIDLSQSKFVRVLGMDQLLSIFKKINLLEVESYDSEDLKSVASAGRATHILQGSLNKAGEIFRIQYTLKDMNKEEIVGSDRLEGKGESSIFSMVDALTIKIKQNLNLSQDQIASDFDKAVGEITTTSPEAFRYYVEGRKLHDQGQWRKSIRMIENAIAIDPEFAMAYRSLGTAYGNLYYRNEHRHYLEKALELKDRLSEREAYLIQAQNYVLQSKELDKAIKLYEKILDTYTEDRIAVGHLIQLYTNLGQSDKAIKVGEKITSAGIELQETNLYHLMNAYRSLGLYEKATNISIQSVNTFSESAFPLLDLAVNYCLQRKYELALGEIEKALTFNTINDVCYWLRGWVYLYMGDFKKAEEDFRRLFDSEELSYVSRGRYGLADLNILKGRFKEAEVQVHHAHEISKKIGQIGYEAEVYLNLGYLFFCTGRLEEALEAYSKALDISTNEDMLEYQLQAHFWIGLIYIYTNSFDKAEKAAEEIKKTMEKAPRLIFQVLYFNLLGRMESNEGNFSEAIELLKKALSLNPFEIDVNQFHALVIESLASAYFKKRDLDNAQVEYEKILSLTEGRAAFGDIYAKSFYMLGKIFEQQGDTAKAIEHYEKFLDLWKDADPRIAEVDDARERLVGLRNGNF
jgi:serine/threonine protein kinase/lipopolysaccharide biosynthesis regulator YciM